MSVKVEAFRYDDLLDAHITGSDHLSLNRIPLELRSQQYDLRLLNGGANQKQPYSPVEHLATERWKNGQAVLERIMAGDMTSRFAISEAALRSFGGGGPIEKDRHIQSEAILHIAACASKGCDVRVAPYSADTRGTTGELVIMHSDLKGSMVGTWGLTEAVLTAHPDIVQNTIDNFNTVWQGSLTEGESIEFMHTLASELVNAS